MPLPALPAFSTKRYFIGVQNGGVQHHVQVRCTPTVSDSQATIDLGFFVSTIVPTTFQDYTYNELLVAELGSDIRNPVSGWSVRAGTFAVAQPDVQIPLSLGARGRSSTGRKAKFFLWGQNFIHDADWLYTPDAGSVHLDAIGIANASPSYFLAIDGSKPVWKLDYTVQYNDHWVKNARP